MKEFFKVISAEDVIETISQFPTLGEERIERDEACGRVLSAPVVSPEDLPHFPRATMDGYAVKAKDTYGASESLPLMLNVVGRVQMGKEYAGRIKRGEAVSINTGGMLPEGADAVIMKEYCHELDEETIEITRAVTPWENVLRVGEDAPRGETVFRAGHKVRFQDVGLLAALGVKEVHVHKRPRVSVISTGDELLAPSCDSVPPGKVRDVNGPTIVAHVRSLGLETKHWGIAPDNEDALFNLCQQALKNSDVLLLSGGSSVGMRDFTLSVIQQLPNSEILFHGIAIKPGKPTILGRSENKAIWGLPGHPVSTMVVMLVFVKRFLYHLEGTDTGLSKALFLSCSTMKAKLQVNIPSAQGRLDFVRVEIVRGDEGIPYARPVYGKSSMISTMTRADGLVVVPTHSEGVSMGSEVEVILF